MSHRRIEIARGLWGVAGLATPRLLLARTGADPEDRSARIVMRILGARQATQAVLSGVTPTGPVLALGVWVDVVHACTAVGLAAMDHRYAKPALADAVIAAGWAGAGRHDLGIKQNTEGERRRSRLARTVLHYLPGGDYLLSQASAPSPASG